MYLACIISVQMKVEVLDEMLMGGTSALVTSVTIASHLVLETIFLKLHCVGLGQNIAKP